MNFFSKVNNGRGVCTLIAFLHFLIGLAGILYHEIWLDEAHHFLLARDSNSIRELYNNASYEGHPLLWNSLLLIITQFSHNIFYMQLLNISIMSACVYFFLRNAPFKIIISVLIVFGYFFIYEYHVISRNYGVGVFLLTIIFIFLSKATKNHYLIGFFLLLLSLTHLYSIIISISLCTILIYLNRENNFKYVYLLVLGLSFIIVYSLQVPEDHFLFKYDHDPYLSFLRIGKAFSIYMKALLPVPDIGSPRIWNSNLFVSFSKTLGTILSVIMMALPLAFFRKNKMVLFFYYFSTLGICFFIYFSPMIVSIRHCGYIFTLFIFSFWLQHIYHPEEEQKSFAAPALIAMLLIHVFAGFYLLYSDFTRPFSNSKSLVQFLKDNKLENRRIILSNLSAGPSVSAYLDRKILYLETGKQESFCKWNTWPFILNGKEFFAKLRQQLRKDTSLLIVNKSNLDENLGKEIEGEYSGFRIVKLATFDGAILHSENYNLYSVSEK